MIANAVKDIKRKEALLILDGSVTDCGPQREQYEVPREIKTSTNYGPAVLLLGMNPKEMKSGC